MPGGRGRLAKGTFRVVVERPLSRAKEAVSAGTWSLRSWPNPDPAIEAERRTLDEARTFTASERMYWRETGQLAYRTGQEYPVEQDKALIGHTAHERVLRGLPEQERLALEAGPRVHVSEPPQKEER